MSKLTEIEDRIIDLLNYVQGLQATDAPVPEFGYTVTQSESEQLRGHFGNLKRKADEYYARAEEFNAKGWVKAAENATAKGDALMEQVSAAVDGRGI